MLLHVTMQLRLSHHAKCVSRARGWVIGCRPHHLVVEPSKVHVPTSLGLAADYPEGLSRSSRDLMTSVLFNVSTIVALQCYIMVAIHLKQCVLKHAVQQGLAIIGIIATLDLDQFLSSIHAIVIFRIC